MKRIVNSLFASIVLLLMLHPAQAQYTPLYAMRQINAQRNDQSRFIDVVRHFYTANWTEAVNANRFYGYYFTGTVANGWSGSGSALKPVYRLYRPATDARYYTSDWNQQQYLISYAGFVSEGIAFYVSTYQRPGTYPLYRVDRNYSPAQYFMWWQTAPEVPETHMLTLRYSDVRAATQSYGFTTNQNFGSLLGYAYPGNLGVD